MQNLKNQNPPEGKSGRGVDEDGLEDPEMYFVFAFSCDVNLDDLTKQVIHEWRRQGGEPAGIVRAGMFRIRNSNCGL